MLILGVFVLILVCATLTFLAFAFQDEINDRFFGGNVNAYGYREDPREQQRRIRKEIDHRMKAGMPSLQCNCMMWSTRTPPRHDANCNVWRPENYEPQVKVETPCEWCGIVHGEDPPLAQARLI